MRFNKFHKKSKNWITIELLRRNWCCWNKTTICTVFDEISKKLNKLAILKLRRHNFHIMFNTLSLCHHQPASPSVVMMMVMNFRDKTITCYVYTYIHIYISKMHTTNGKQHIICQVLSAGTHWQKRTFVRKLDKRFVRRSNEPYKLNGDGIGASHTSAIWIKVCPIWWGFKLLKFSTLLKRFSNIL